MNNLNYTKLKHKNINVALAMNWSEFKITKILNEI